MVCGVNHWHQILTSLRKTRQGVSSKDLKEWECVVS